MKPDKVSMVLYVLGGILLLGALFSFLMSYISVTYGLEENSTWENEYYGTLFTLCCAVPFLIFGLIFIGGGYYFSIKDKPKDEVANVLKAYRTFRVTELADKVNRSEAETEKLVMECINEGLVKGYIDSNTGKFISEPRYGAPVSPKSAKKSGAKPRRKVPLKKAPTEPEKFNDCPTCGRPMLYDHLNKRYFCPDCDNN
jgi:hypothetical protein